MAAPLGAIPRKSSHARLEVLASRCRRICHTGHINLPAEFQVGDRFFSVDFRLVMIFRVRELHDLNTFGEIFNVLNAANLNGPA